MKQQEFLAIEVRLLIARHGRIASLKAIAEALNVTQQELQNDLSALLNSVPTKGKMVKAFVVADLELTNADSTKHLLALEARYENRTFLPELRDVKRFLDRHGNRTPKLKSRDVGKRRVFETLAKLETLELKQLASAKESGAGFSSLGVISDQILNRQRDD